MERMSGVSFSFYKQKEDTVYTEVFQKYYRELVFFASRIVADTFASEDIVQEVFVKLYEQQAFSENILSLKSYLFKVVKNSCLDYLKHQRAMERHRTACAENISEDYILASIAEAEALTIIYEKIDKLPPACKKIILLALDGHSGVEIAEMLGVADSTVRAQKRRGLSLLRQDLPPELLPLLAVFMKLLT